MLFKPFTEIESASQQQIKTILLNMLFKPFTEIEGASQQQIKAILLKLSFDNPLPGRSYD